MQTEPKGGDVIRGRCEARTNGDAAVPPLPHPSAAAGGEPAGEGWSKYTSDGDLGFPSPRPVADTPAEIEAAIARWEQTRGEGAVRCPSPLPTTLREEEARQSRAPVKVAEIEAGSPQGPRCQSVARVMAWVGPSPASLQAFAKPTNFSDDQSPGGRTQRTVDEDNDKATTSNNHSGYTM